jgi:hypothetical protein
MCLIMGRGNLYTFLRCLTYFSSESFKNYKKAKIIRMWKLMILHSKSLRGSALLST